MSTKKIITVIGATGLQGGAVASTFLKDPQLSKDWAVRAVTRDVTKESAKKLASQGAESFRYVPHYALQLLSPSEANFRVQADLDNLESLVKAFAGSHTVFGVTNYWEKVNAETEIQQGKNLADAAKKANVQHYIWSSLLNINELSNGKLPNVYHFDSKAKVEVYVRELGIPASFFMPGFYMSGINQMLMKPSPPDNAYTLGMPTKSSAPIPLFNAGDSGKYVKAIVLNREEMLGKRLYAATEYLTGQEVVDVFKKVYPETGKTARFFEVPEDMFRGFLSQTGSPEFVVQELYENMRLLEEFGYYGNESLDFTHKLVKDPLTTWEEFAKTVPEWQSLQ